MKIGVVDIESTGFLAQGGKIVEVGIVELDLETGETKVLFDAVMHETGITREEVEKSWIVNNSTLTVEDVRQSKNLEKYREELQSIFDKYKCTAFNKAFDFGFLRDRGFNITNEAPCPMIVATNICKLPNTNGYAGYKYPKVTEAMEFFFPEIEDYEEAHRGCSDAIDEAKIIYRLYKDGHLKIE